MRGQATDNATTMLHYGAEERRLAQYPLKAKITAIVLTLGSLWVAEYRQPDVKRIDTRTGRMRLGAQLTSVAGSLAAGGGYVFAGMPNEDTVARIEPGHSHDPVYRIAGKRPEQLTYARGRVYVASRYDGTLVVIDPKTMRPAQNPLTVRLNPFAVTSDRRHVWVTGLGDDTVTRVDLG